MAAAAGGGLISSKDFFLDTFALRQWDDADYKGSRISHDKADFVARVQAARDAGAELADGYAPFCKHIFVPNFVGAKVGSLPITDANRALVRHGYEARTDYELAVLCRWFDESEVGALPEAKWLDIILYSREQIIAENSSRGEFDAASLPAAPWGIISVKSQDEPYETPMEPITMMRNALGKEEGGSGVPLEREKYRASVDYWRERAPVKK